MEAQVTQFTKRNAVTFKPVVTCAPCALKIYSLLAFVVKTLKKHQIRPETNFNTCGHTFADKVMQLLKMTNNVQKSNIGAQLVIPPWH